MVHFIRKFTYMPVLICMVCILFRLGAAYGVAAFRARNYQWALLNTASFYDQHAMAVALGVCPKTESPTEAEIMCQLRNMMSAYRKSVRMNPFWANRSYTFDCFCSKMSDVENRSNATADDIPSFLRPPFVSYWQAGPEESAAFLAHSRLRQKLHTSFDEPIEEFYIASSQTNHIVHTELLSEVFKQLFKRCPELSCSVENSTIGDVKCLDVSGFVKNDCNNSDPKIRSCSGLDFSMIPQVPINIDMMNASPKSIMEELQRKHLIAFSLFNTNFVVRIVMQHEEECF